MSPILGIRARLGAIFGLALRFSGGRGQAVGAVVAPSERLVTRKARA